LATLSVANLGLIRRFFTFTLLLAMKKKKTGSAALLTLALELAKHFT
jgi:hypothetical protein